MADQSLTFNLFGKDVSASAAVNEFQSKAGYSIDSLGKRLGALAVGYIGVTGVIDFGKKTIEAASEAEQAQLKLNVALKNTHSGFTAQSQSVDEAHQKMMNLGFTGAQVDQALATMTTGLGSGTKALNSLQLAADLARFKNMDLNSSALLVTKAWEGQTRPLRQLGIDLPVYAGNAQSVRLANEKLAAAQQAVIDLLAKYPDAADAASKHHDLYTAAVARVAAAQQLVNDKSSSGQTIIDALSKKMSGEAAKSADTLAGQQQVLNAQFDQLQVEGGKFLDPMLTELLKGSNAFLSFQNDMSVKYQKFRDDSFKVWADIGQDAVNTWGAVLAFITGHPVHAEIQYRNVVPPPPSGGGTLGVGGYRLMASGGVVRAQPGGTPAILAEAGVDEAVIPLTSQVLSQLGGHGNGNTFYITGVDEVAIANAVMRRLNAAGKA